MPYIPLESHLPGITGLLEYRRDTAQPIRELTEILLRGPSSLTRGERELIATVVSNGNQCKFCSAAHAATVDMLLGEHETSKQVKADILTAPVSEKMKALLTIADKVREDGKLVTTAHIEKAKAEGATDIEIHDTVLIAGLFCLYNRYVDGMATAMPEDNGYFTVLADRLVNHGYYRLPQGYDHLKKH
ncbi:carboxymuconolactone decarboxylase family protein [Mucilaginibacter gotjawali]|uniref:Peroxidase-related enzyme n=2 Tax=Mucilaginibacter gotjawali TaxID=1550579 RepID=A0A839SH53_9SPHI|nr:peroxidase-related enzyme [Mucilaginibacter gotjawali]MBB3056624.1 putative peroxidase-related enzyme [Mucilaginibacter gotjawali]BAU52673.1 Carboxymuconolactone decarboxylase family protein [Mucilaginibacter gotjawali]